jgi:hypothetical protein
VASEPLLGEERFTSAITDISEVSKNGKQSRTAGAVSIASCNCPMGKRLAAKSSRTPSMIELKTLMASLPLLGQFHDQVRSTY